MRIPYTLCVSRIRHAYPVHAMLIPYTPCVFRIRHAYPVYAMRMLGARVHAVPHWQSNSLNEWQNKPSNRRCDNK